MPKRTLVRLLPYALLLAICALAYGIQVAWLGYYLDDWIILLAYQTGGVDHLSQYAFIDNRPLVFWIWWMGFKLLGAAPLGWQLWTAFWHWLAAVASFAVMRQLWPGRVRQALGVALLFAVYPLFLRNPTALAFSVHWFSFALFLLSTWLMLLAVQRPRLYLPLSLLAILLDAAQLYSQEYFVGLELIRPVLLFMAMPGLKLGQRLKRAALHWSPYLVQFTVYLVWRFQWMPTPGRDHNSPEMLYMLFSQPLKAIAQWGSVMLQDLSEGLVGVWHRSMDASTFTLNPLSNWLAWAGAVFAALLVGGYFWWDAKRDPEPRVGQREIRMPDDAGWILWALGLGFLTLLLGFLPGWAVGRSYANADHLYNDRFGLAAMWGAAILVVATIQAIIRQGRVQTVTLCILIGLGVGQQFRAASTYRWSWEEQTRLLWQMKWRAPGLEAPTAVLGSGALVQYMGDWINGSAINLAYAPEQRTSQLDYWYVDLYLTDIRPQLEDGQDIVDSYNYIRFRSGADQAVVLAYNLVDNQCAWLVDESDRHNPYLPEQVRAALPLSDLGRIDTTATSGLPEEIFGPEPPPTWCTYYEKADLALQLGHYEQVMALWDEAMNAGKRPLVETEYVPFIQAAARTGRWELAVDLTRRANFPYYVMNDYLCVTWRDLREEVGASPELEQSMNEVATFTDCGRIWGSDE